VRIQGNYLCDVAKIRALHVLAGDDGDDEEDEEDEDEEHRHLDQEDEEEEEETIWTGPSASMPVRGINVSRREERSLFFAIGAARLRNVSRRRSTAGVRHLCGLLAFDRGKTQGQGSAEEKQEMVFLPPQTAPEREPDESKSRLGHSKIFAVRTLCGTWE
jgi:hypothetical protein